MISLSETTLLRFVVIFWPVALQITGRMMMSRKGDPVSRPVARKRMGAIQKKQQVDAGHADAVLRQAAEFTVIPRIDAVCAASAEEAHIVGLPRIAADGAHRPSPPSRCALP